MNKIIRMNSEKNTSSLASYFDLLTDKNTCLKHIQEHFPDISGNDDNFNKQATQASYCVRQAKEYFEAANTTTIVTKPLLLYYGFVSLTKACTLICGDGTNSFDYLRKENLHSHHGVELVKGFETKKTSNLFDALNGIKSKVFYKNDQPWGHFSLYYEIARPEKVIIESSKTFEGSSISQTIFDPIDTCHKVDISKINSLNISTLGLLLSLPDLFDFFKYQEIENTYLARCSLSASKNYSMGVRVQGIKQERSVLETTAIFIYDLPEERQGILEYYKENNSGIVINKMDDETTYHIISRKQYKENEVVTYYIPDICADIHNQMYCILNPGGYLPESVSMFMVLFNFGMISRYYPDYWMKLVDDSFLNRTVLEKIFDIIQIKLKLNILNQITGIIHCYE